MSKPLEGKIALVTGASRGIGAAIAQRLAADGAELVLHYGSGRAEAEAVAAALREAGNKAHLVQADLAAADGGQQLVKRLATLQLPRIDILVNNAGVAPTAVLAETRTEEFEKIVNVNMRSLFFITQGVVPLMPAGGRIVNISTAATRVSFPGITAYTASKGTGSPARRTRPMTLVSANSVVATWNRALRPRSLEHRLRAALERSQFELHYQPKVNVKTRQLVGVEALIRWNEPGTGLVLPSDFLPLLESTQLIVEVGEWVLEQAVRDCQHWQQHRLPPVRIAVNVSPVQLRHPDFVQRFFDICAPLAQIGYGLDIEITEGLLQSDSEEVGKLRSLRQAGVRIAIDDFGTGHSSLSRLAELPIDTLKIDRTFTSRLARNGSGRSVVRTILALARSFELTVVAEGVETQEEFRLLTELGCDQGQGFLLAKPMPRDDLTNVLQHGHGRLIRPVGSDQNARI